MGELYKMSTVANERLRLYRKKIEDYNMVLSIDKQIKSGEVENFDGRPLLSDEDIKDINMKIDALSVERDKLLDEDNGYKDLGL